MAREIGYRLGESHAPWPLPPARMMYTVISTRWAATFLDSGEKIVAAMESALNSAGKSLTEYNSILDFGCGCGRLLRHLPKYTKAKLYGCDYNAKLIAWCAKDLPIAEFKVNPLEPPLPYPDQAFDFIYARSVFTHLSEEAQTEWFRELMRVLKPGGILYLTMHGEQFFGQLSPEEQERVRNGGIVVRLAEEEGRNICTSFEVERYVRFHLPSGLRLLKFIPGLPQEHLLQDSYVIERESREA